MGSQERPASRTALGVAILRALHQLYDESPKILNDSVIPLLLGEDTLQKALASRDWFNDAVNIAMRSHVVLRSRYTEDCLQESVLCGVRQYVILGSGFDTFAYRQPDWAAPLRIFEVDHAASQRAKVERLRAAGIAIPPNVEFVAADFESATLREILANNSSLDFHAPAFFSCLGVLVYLPQATVRAILQLIASFPALSEVVLTFSQGRRPGDDQYEGFSTLAQSAAAVGEPWLSYHDPDALSAELSEMGFSRVAILSPAEAEQLYYRDRSDGLPPPRRATIARAIV